MNKTKLGKTNIEVSALAMGSDLIGSKIDSQTAFKLFDFYHGNGGNFIDTANMYACWLPGCKGGESETTIGAWMKERRNRNEVVISSKLAFDYPGCAGGLSAGEIQRECEKSLKRLQTDRIDVYYAHRDDREIPLEETMKAFDALVKAGKVRAIGASNLFLWRVAEANLVSRTNNWAEYSVVEQRYTYLRPRHGADFGPQIFISEELKDFARAHGVALIGYSILLQGAYTRSDRQVPTQFAGPDSDERLAALKVVAAEAGCSPPQAIIAWMRQSDPAILPIIAGSKTEQLRENIAALNIMLSPDQMSRLDTAGNPSLKQGWIQPT
ncbi:MAG TPA: aldo/keto reductase [Acidobacteriaceae bacterium]|nr:aldo/keto reductase [Acidobacteriaceae bacterium]